MLVFQGLRANRTVQVLNVASNKIDDAGAVVLAEVGWDEYHEYSLEFAIIIG